MKLTRFDLGMAALHGALLLFGLFLAGFQANEARRVLSVSDWTPVPARVTSASVTETMSPRSTTPAYRLKLVYEYEAGGKLRRSERFGFADAPTTDRAWPDRRIAGEFAPGKTVSARVNPENPDEAFIENGGAWYAFVLAGVGLVFAGVGIAGLRMIFEKPAKKA